MKELHSQHDKNKGNTAREQPISGGVSGLHQNYYTSAIRCNTSPPVFVRFRPYQRIQRRILKMGLKYHLLLK